MKTKEKPKLLVLLDAHAIIHRAYHALPEFLSSAGMPTGALYGLSTMLMKIVTELKPDYMVACYDLPGKTFRHEAYEAYKAKRVKADDALIAQLQSSREIFEAFNIPTYDSPGFEADDVIGTIVDKLKKQNNLKVIIASGDMDTMQLVRDKRVLVYTLRKGIADTILYDEEKVKERFGLPPALLPDFKGLRGDPSDNIVGIKGIGEKTATKLIQKFGTVEEIYKKGEKALIKAGIRPRIVVLIKENKEEALFSKTLAKIRSDAPVNFAIPVKTFWENMDEKKIEQVFRKFEFKSLLERVWKFFGTNGKDIPAQAELAIPEVGEVNLALLKETSIALWLLDSDTPNPDLPAMLSYSGKNTLREAHEYIFRELEQKKLDKVFGEIERPIISVVERMERTGVLLDKEYFEELSREYHKKLDKLVAKIYVLSGGEFNINSPKQLGEVLFGKLGLKSSKRGASGALSTKIEVLEELAEESEIVRKIINYRELAKLLSTYVDVLPKMAGEDGRLHARFIQNGATTGRFSSQEPNLQNLPIKSELGRRIRTGFIAPPAAVLAAFDYSQIELRVAAILSKDEKMTQIFREGKDIHAGVASYVFGVPIEKVDPEMRRRAKVINFGIIYGMGVTALRKNLGGTREEAQKFYDNYFRQFSGIKRYLEETKIFARKHGYTETLFGRRRYFPNINSKIPYLASMAERTATNAPIQGTATADIIKLAVRFADEDLKEAKLENAAKLVLTIHDELVYEIDQSVLPRAVEIIKMAMEGVLERSFIRLKSPVPILVHAGSGANLGEVK
ncbi:MAG: DNA polymerase [Patescibacteria group bacterium]